MNDNTLQGCRLDKRYIQRGTGGSFRLCNPKAHSPHPNVGLHLIICPKSSTTSTYADWVEIMAQRLGLELGLEALPIFISVQGWRLGHFQF